MGGFGTGVNALSIGGTSFGMGQGLDVQTIVQTLTQAAQSTESVYTNEQTLYQNQTSALDNISNLLTSLQLSAQTLQDPAGPLDARVASSSNSNVVTATASNGIPAGSYSVVVNNLASNDTWLFGGQNGNPLATGDTVFGDSGSLTIQVGTNQLTVPIQASGTGGQTNTLNALAAYINSSSQNPGVTATVVTDTTGARLALTSNTTGSPGAITISGTATTSGSEPGLSYSEITPAAQLNANATIDGITIQPSTNSVTGVIPGVTFNLTGVNTSTSPATVSVSQDTNQASTAINSFVSAYNAVIEAINTQFTYTAGASSQPPLFSDSSLQQIQATLTTDVNYIMSGNSGINGLSSIGVNLQQDGTLSVDSDTLNAALSSNPAAVQTLFQGPDYVSGLAGQFYNDTNTLNDPVSGAIALDLQGINSQEQDVTQTISEFNANLQQQEQIWTAEYSQVNATMQQLPLLLAQAGDSSSSTSSSS
jgi:flagellar hook-associated protein 2